MRPDRADKIAVDREIVPFERVADHAGNNDFAPVYGLQRAYSPRPPPGSARQPAMIACFHGVSLGWRSGNGKPRGGAERIAAGAIPLRATHRRNLRLDYFAASCSTGCWAAFNTAAASLATLVPSK